MVNLVHLLQVPTGEMATAKLAAGFDAEARIQPLSDAGLCDARQQPILWSAVPEHLSLTS